MRHTGFRRGLLVLAAAGGALVCSSGLVASGPRDLWMAPAPDVTAARAALARATADLTDGRAADALPVFLEAGRDGMLGPYARLYAARAYLALDRHAEAAAMAAAVAAEATSPALREAADLLAADVAVAAKDPAAEFDALRRLAARQSSAPPTPSAQPTPPALMLRLLKAAVAAGNTEAATQAFDTLYYSHAAAPETREALATMASLGVQAPEPSRDTVSRHLGRAERLYAAGQYTDARAAFDALRPLAAASEQELITLRLAETDVFLRKYDAALPVLRDHMATASARRSEARYHYLTALRESGRMDEYQAQLRAFVDSGADPALAERAMNDLGTFYILADDDGRAAEVFAEQYRRFPTGAFADRAAWKSGWWAYKQGEYAETIRVFESAAQSMRRANYRPWWLYWAARSHAHLGHRDEAIAAYRRVIADYRNSYYGRAAIREVERLRAATRPNGAGPVSPARFELPATIVPSPRPDNAGLIEDLLAAGMYEEAVAELRRLQAAGGGSPLIEATIAYALNRQGRLRPAITAMRQAYPQFMAEGGEALPREILTVIFPLDYWELIQSHAARRGLDKFLVAALVAQESTFQADVRSAADAWGLMQIIPGTGRRYAASLGIRPFSTSRLIDPEINVRIGTTYLADLLKRFGDPAAALAAYNAGEQRVTKWLADRPGMDRDEFIDDIPFPETQNYVKRILGTAEDYRQLYR